MKVSNLSVNVYKQRRGVRRHSNKSCTLKSEKCQTPRNRGGWKQDWIKFTDSAKSSLAFAELANLIKFSYNIISNLLWYINHTVSVSSTAVFRVLASVMSRDLSCGYAVEKNYLRDRSTSALDILQMQEL